jgi:hypothetical protein
MWYKATIINRKKNVLMEEIIGTIHLQLSNVGSKSEGVYAHLVLESGDDYILYQSGHLAMDDAYFKAFDGLQVKVTGEIEPEMNYIRIKDIQTL